MLGIKHPPFFCACVFLTSCLQAQCETPILSIRTIELALQQRVIEPGLPMEEVQVFTESRVLPMPVVESVAAWEKYIDGRREAVLRDVVFRGQAANWRDAECRIEWLDTIAGGPGYHIKKLRFEAIPGLWIPALLYEPDDLSGKVPVVLNVNGHDRDGKAADYKQLRCINQAKRGMIALNLEWIGMGQLNVPGFNHYKSNQIDLCGTSGVAVHYLEMSRGIDILLSHPNADPERVAVAGLSGGGWQTIFISSLDPRVTLSNPVAGYSSYVTRARHLSDLGDSEQTPVDLAMTADYAHLTAMRAPRPTLLTFNAKDQCCFRADHAKDPLLAAAQPIYDLYGKGDFLRAHVNDDPGTHNFGLDNRQQLYKMFGDFFFTDDSNFSADEIPSDAEVKSAEDLHVDLPEGNLDFHAIASSLAKNLPERSLLETESIAAQRERLRELLRVDDYQAQIVETSEIRSENGTVNAWRLRIDNWTVPATEFVPAGEGQGTVILMGDEGRGQLHETVESLLAEKKRVIAVDPFYFGESKIAERDFLFGLLVSSVGKRPLGIQSAQIAALAHMLAKEKSGKVSLHAVGPRTSLIAVTAAALDPEAFETVKTAGAFNSLHDIIEQDMTVQQAPELFSFGLLREFDISDLKAIAEGVQF